MNIQKGTDYEIYIKNYLNNNDVNNIAWLWKDVPYENLRKSGILGNWNLYRINRKQLNILNENNENLLQDTGTDILLLNNDKYYIVQCKNYTGGKSIYDCFSSIYLGHKILSFLCKSVFSLRLPIT